ncbi:Outer membrane protein assembly factor BamB [bacterium HR36]|nr:Outer membrane protein assembly factor BamB [bacterium HR36]
MYVNTESCSLFALNATTGRQIWSLWLGDPLPTMPTIANGRVFTAYPAGNGLEILPQIDLSGPRFAPRQAENGPIAAGPRRVLACLNAKTGQVNWLRWIDQEILSCPVADNEDVYVATFGGILYGFRQRDGALRLAVKSYPTSAPVLVDQYVLYSRVRPNTNTETIVAHRKTDNVLVLETTVRAARAWPQDSGANSAYVYQGSRPLFWDGKILASLGEEVHCLGAAHGMSYWSQKVGRALPPAVAGKAVVVATMRGEILLLHPGHGEPLKKYALGETLTFPPAVQDGKIYVVTNQGKLVCIKTGDAEITAWPCWGSQAHRNSVL